MIARRITADGKTESLIEVVSMSVDKAPDGKPTTVTLTTQNALGVQTPMKVTDGIVTMLAATGEVLGAVDFSAGRVT